jgi:hypothetical protein
MGNLVRITFLNEFVFFNVFAAWFVILVKELNRGTLSISGHKTDHIFSQRCH